jgi:HAD superfamily hydrolase (TIGR01509 family)
MNYLDKDKPSVFDITRIKGLLFDVDGTLSDTDDHMVERISRFLSPAAWLFRNRDPRGFARRMVMVSETPANFMYGLADSLGIDAPIAKIYNWVSKKCKKENRQQVKFRIIDGVQEMLAQFKGRFPMAVVSARDALTTLRFLEMFDLLPFFDVVVTSQTCNHTKPYPDPVIFAAEQMDLTPESCVMIGDTIVDIRSGKSAGAQTIGVLCGFGTARELNRAGADLLLSSTPEILEILL